MSENSEGASWLNVKSFFVFFFLKSLNDETAKVTLELYPDTCGQPYLETAWVNWITQSEGKLGNNLQGYILLLSKPVITLQAFGGDACAWYTLIRQGVMMCNRASLCWLALSIISLQKPLKCTKANYVMKPYIWSQSEPICIFNDTLLKQKQMRKLEEERKC